MLISKPHSLSIIAVLAMSCGDMSSIETSSSALGARRTRNIQGKLSGVAAELQGLRSYIDDSGWNDGNTACGSRRTGWGRGTMLDAKLCIADPSAVIAAADCSVRPTSTDAEAYLWMLKCATSQVMVEMWANIDCDQVRTRAKRSYGSVFHHFAARKCRLSLNRRCEFAGARFGHNDVFIAYDAAAATRYDAPYGGHSASFRLAQSRNCEDLMRKYRCNDGVVEGVGHNEQPQALTCTQSCSRQAISSAK
ncbi:MAG: hypothetical protein AAF449_08680, partial [Myxococcota bacterium]